MEVLILILISILLAIGFILFYEQYFIFFPSSYPEGLHWDSTPHNSRFFDVEFESTDGETLHGWWYPSDETDMTYLWFHGNAGNVTLYREDLEFLVDLPLQILVFDYRGYGKSTGFPTEEGVYQDGIAAYEHLRNNKNLSPDQLILMGQSMGGGITTYVASHKPCAGVILESVFTSVPDLTKNTLPVPYLDRLFQTKLDSLSRISSITAPLLFIHGTLDQTVPISFGKKLYRQANEPKQFETFENAFHFNVRTSNPKKYRACHKRFVGNVIGN